MVNDKFLVPKQLLRKPITWILIADKKQAQTYIRKEIGKSHNEKTVERKLVSVEVLFTEKTSAISSEIEAEEHFAKIIATFLNIARAKRRFNRLVMIASAKLLSEIRVHLNKTTKMSIIAELAEDLTNCDNKELTTHLEDIA